MVHIWLPDNQKELEEEALREAEKGAFEEHINWFHENTGYHVLPHGRMATTAGERIAATYIRETLDSYGFNAAIEEVDAYLQIPLEAEVEILDPERKVLAAVTRAFSPRTSETGVVGELYYAKGGLREDYEGIDIAGKIALLEMGMKPIRRDKALIAEEMGASAYVLMNSSGPLEKRSYWRGGEKRVWGNPTPERMRELPKLPAALVCRADGEYLKALCDQGRVKISLRTRTNPRMWTKVLNVVATMKGKQEPEKYMLLSGHYDVWTGGTLCNGAGNSTMIDAGRILLRFSGKLRRGVKIAFWSGHEDYGPYVGSTWWLDNHWDDVNRNCVAVRVIDTLGVKGPYRALATYRELQPLVRMIVKEILEEDIDIAQYQGKYGSDMSFLGVGVPLFLERTMYKPGDPKAAAITLDESPLRWVGWQMHDPEDSPDKIDRDSLLAVHKVILISTMRVCNSFVLPYDFVGVADDFIRTLKHYQAEARGSLDLQKAVTEAEEFRTKAIELEEAIGKLEATYGTALDGNTHFERKLTIVNNCLMRLTRTYSPIYYSLSGKYGQDNSTSLVTEPIPILRETSQLGKARPGTDEYGTLKTKLTRENNKTQDALYSACESISVALRNLAM